VAGSGRARIRARSEGVMDEGDEIARVQRSWRESGRGELEGSIDGEMIVPLMIVGWTRSRCCDE
jgi:hypothetical protein